MMKRYKCLDEVHEIMEGIYEEEKDLTIEQRLKKLKKESDSFLAEHKLKLTRVKRPTHKKIAV